MKMLPLRIQHLVVEGIRKMALLWQLVKNGMLEKGSVFASYFENEKTD